MEFVCRLGTPEGHVVQEIHDARDEGMLRDELERRGLHVFAIERRSALPRFLSPAMFRRRKIALPTLLVFNQEMAALLKAGLPLLQALNLMLERQRDPVFRAILEQIREKVKSGVELSDAFATFGDAFPPLYASTLKAGERTGELEQVIRRFVRYLRIVITARKKVVSALVYPSVLVGLGISMLFVMSVFVIPKFTVFYDSLDIQLPVLTRGVLGFSVYLRENIIWILLGVGGVWFVTSAWRRSDSGRLFFDAAKLKIPFLGKVLHRFAMSEFCRSTSTLLAGGLPLVPTLEISVSATGNLAIRGRLRPAIQLVREGRSLAAALESTGVVPDLAIDMVKVGEATGSLDVMLGNASEFFDDEVETRMERILGLIEPMMLVLTGIMVGLLLISMYMPLFSALGKIG